MTRRLAWCVLLVACGSSEPVAPEAAPAVPPEQQTVLDVKSYVDTEVGALHEAVSGMCATAPTDAAGWEGGEGNERRARMRLRWAAARNAYEHVEGAIAILFPELDHSMDGRYEHSVELTPDPDPFDGTGFTGMHAIERILWADRVTSDVVRFEEALRGYTPARAPATDEEATRFREGLCARLVEDTERMQRQLAPLALDHQTAWRGVQGSIEEQAEKVALSATGQDESRYAQRTLADMRANLEASRAVLDAYAPLIAQHDDARPHVDAVRAHLARLETAYGTEGDALPPVPEGFDPDAPSDDAYGQLHALLAEQSDPEVDGSLAHHLRAAGLAMGIPPLARVR